MLKTLSSPRYDILNSGEGINPFPQTLSLYKLSFRGKKLIHSLYKLSFGIFFKQYNINLF